MKKFAVIFDLDGVIVSTDEYHYQGWQQLADEEDIAFDRKINERLRGVSRMESLEIILKKSSRAYTDEEKVSLAERKNNYYRKLLENITPDDILPGVNGFLAELKAKNIPVAIGSSSRNAPTILERIGLADYFDAVADGNHIEMSKPDPEVFLLAAEKMSMPPENCIVIEDAEAGVEAALNANMKVVGVGAAQSDARANLQVNDLSKLNVKDILSLIRKNKMKQKNVLIIMSDQHNKHVCGCYGNDLVRTPNIDRLAAEGVLNHNAYCASPLCVPSRMSFMTCRTPSQNEVWTNQHILSSAIPTWAHHLGSCGVETALIGRMHFVGSDQLHGFEKRPLGETCAAFPGSGTPTPLKYYVKDAYAQNRTAASIAGHGKTFVQSAAEKETQTTCDFLREHSNSERPFVVVAGFYPPHSPYIAPKELFDYYYERIDIPQVEKEQTASTEMVRQVRGFLPPLDTEQIRKTRAAYFALCEYMDQQVGEILTALEEANLTEETLVIYTSDHGDMSGEHGLFGKSNFHEASVSVPLVARLPGVIQAGSGNHNLCSLMDIGPSLVDLYGAQPMNNIAGKSILTQWCDRNNSSKDENVVFSELMNIQHANSDHPARMVRKGRFKLWIYPSQTDIPPTLFDLEVDPQERRNLASLPEYFAKVQELTKLALDNWNWKKYQRESRNKTEDFQSICAYGKAICPYSPYATSYEDEEVDIHIL